MIELFLSIVDAVWHFVFHLGEYVNHTASKIFVGFCLGMPLLFVGWTIFFHYFVKAFVYWGTTVYHQLHMDKKFDGTDNEFVKFRFRQEYPKTWIIVLLWRFLKKPLEMITWDNMNVVGKFDVQFNAFTFKVYRTDNLKKFIDNGWEIPELDEQEKANG